LNIFSSGHQPEDLEGIGKTVSRVAYRKHLLYLVDHDQYHDNIPVNRSISIIIIY